METLMPAALSLCARALSACARGGVPKGKCDRSPADFADTVERGIREFKGLAVRLLTGFVALGIFFLALSAASPPGSGMVIEARSDGSVIVRGGSVQPSFTPFSAAMWSDSIGR